MARKAPIDPEGGAGKMKGGTKRARRVRLEMESLDGRTLPSAGVTATLARGVLTIVGTAGDDTITVGVTQPSGNRGVNAALVSVLGVRQFPAKLVQQIVIRGGVGNDRVTLTQTAQRLIPARITLGDGNNVVRTGREADTIVVGNGNNVVSSGGGRDTIRYGGGVNLINGVSTAPPSSADPPGGPVIFPPPSLLPVTPPSSLLGDPVSTLERTIIDLINQERVSAGLSPLQVNQKLCAAAQIQAKNMARLNEFGHVLADTSTPSPLDRLRAVGYSYGAAGENIAYNYQGPRQVVAGWMGSQGHRANILDGDYTETGLAVRFNSDGEPYYVQVFGSPM